MISTPARLVLTLSIVTGLTLAGRAQDSISPARTGSDQSEVVTLVHELRELRRLIQGLTTDVADLRQAVGNRKRSKPAVAGAVEPETPATSTSRNDLGIVQIPDNWDGIDVVVFEDSATRLRMPARVARIAGFDNRLVGLNVISPTVVEVSGDAPGQTTATLSFDDEDRPAFQLRIVVGPPRRPNESIDDVLVRAREAAYDHVYTLLKGRSRLVKRANPVARIAVSDPSKADIVQYTPNEVGIVALQPGETDVTLWFDNEPEPVQVLVKVLQGRKPTKVDLKESDPSVARANLGIELALDKKVTLEFENAELVDVLRALRETMRINIVVDQPGLEEEGISTDTPISISIGDVSARSVLNLILEPLNLAWVIENEVLLITSQLRAQGRLIAAAYPVADLLPGVNQDAEELSFERLIDLITTVVEPDSWQEVGGLGSIRANGTTLSLVIRQTQQTHEEVSNLLDQLRRLQQESRRSEVPVTGDAGASRSGIQKDSTEDSSRSSENANTVVDTAIRPIDSAVSPPAESRRMQDLMAEFRRSIVSLNHEGSSNNSVPHFSAHAHHALNSPVSTTFDMQLSPALVLLGREASCYIIADWRDLERASVSRRTRVSLMTEGIPLRDALQEILSPLNLTFVPQGRLILIRSQSTANLIERQYAVSDLLNVSIKWPVPADFDRSVSDLIELIKRTVNPQSWSGEDVSISSTKEGNAILIRHTEGTHQRVASLLKSLRSQLPMPGLEETPIR